MHNTPTLCWGITLPCPLSSSSGAQQGEAVPGLGRGSWQGAEGGEGTLVPPRSGALPQRLADHVLVRDAVVGEGLVPRGVQRVPQGFGSQLVGLEEQRSWASVGSTPGGSLGRGGSPAWR